jgi:hypothetical protein
LQQSGPREEDINFVLLEKYFKDEAVVCVVTHISIEISKAFPML